MSGKLQNIFQLQKVRENCFKINSMWSSHTARVVFGGHLVGLAAQACNETVSNPKLNIHSIHSCFLRGGARNTPTYYTVKGIRDGKNFCSRSVSVSQGDKGIFTMLASYHNESEEAGHVLNFIPKMPVGKHHSQVAPLGDIIEELTPTKLPDAVFDRPSYVKEFINEFPIVLKPIDPQKFIIQSSRPTNAIQCWIKVNGIIGQTQNHHRALLAFLSDISAGYTPASNQPDFNIAIGTSLDHSIWFHRDVDTTKWIFYETMSPTMNLCRALVTGRFWSENGDLLATVMQENLFRPRM